MINHEIVNNIAEYMRIKGVDKHCVKQKDLPSGRVWFAWGSLDSRYGDIEIRSDGQVFACISPHPQTTKSILWSVPDDQVLKTVDALDDYWSGKDTDRLKEVLKTAERRPGYAFPAR